MAEIIWLGRDNSIDLAFVADGLPVSADAMTRWYLKLTPVGGGTPLEFDSNTDPALFDNTETRTVRGQDVKILKVVLGGESIPAGRYVARLVAYDASHPAGLVWGEFLTEVKP